MSQGNLIIPPQGSSWRQIGGTLYPTYMQGPVWSRYLWAMNTIQDACVDAASYAVRAAIPSLAPPDALTWIAQDRQIFQGPGETSAAYVARLIQWLDLWRHAGSSTGLLLAYLSYLTPLAPEVMTVQSSGGASPLSTWDTYFAGSAPFPAGQSNPTPPYHQVVTTANWDWDGASQPYYYPRAYWRKWIIIQSSGPQAPWAAPTATWASGGAYVPVVAANATYGSVYTNGGTPATSSGTSFNWGGGTCWGWSGTAQQSQQLTALAAAWKSAGAWVPWIVVSYNAAWFQPTNVIGTDMPDGTWGYYGKVVSDSTYGTKYIPARPPATTCTLICGTNDGQNRQPLGVG